MSHKTGHQRRKRKMAKQLAKVVATPAGQKSPPAAPHDEARQANIAPDLLTKLAQTLNTMKTRGIGTQLSHDAVITEYGYVFCINGFWQTRTRNLTEFADSGL